jgi:molecular chaperone HscC
VVGAAAKEHLVTRPAFSATMFKRYMGTNREFMLGRRRFRPEELSALVLKSLVADAAAHFGSPIESAVVTVPAYFNDKQRKATRAAGELAGLRIERLLNEPTAAALSFQLHQARDESKLVVCDLGGGTFDVSILEIFEGLVEVRSTTGDNFLGGEDFSEALVDAFMAKVGTAAGVALDDKRSEAYQMLRRQADLAKLALSDAEQAAMSLPWRGSTVSWTLTRDDFDALCLPLLQRIRQPLVRALRDSSLAPEDIDEVVLAGGATRMPMVRNAVSRMFGRIARSNRNPDHVIAEGAAVMAGLLANDETLREVVMTDVCPYTLGTSVFVPTGPNTYEQDVFSPIIERNTIVPTSRSRRFQTVSDQQAEVSFPVYQGEGRNVKHNTLLGEITVPVPPRPRGEVSVECRFTYDADGLLDVDVEVIGTGTTRQMTILSQDSGLTPKDIALRRDKLQALKVHPREQADNLHAMARAERMYEECLGPTREMIGTAIGHFSTALEQQDPAPIDAQRKRLNQLVDHLENIGTLPDEPFE